jgi:lipopolysaccharide/colanic/teichoic acid biosynthesis glycosyltransferase
MLSDGHPRTVSLALHSEVHEWSDSKQVLRRVFDFVSALAGLTVLAPALGAIAAAIKLDDGGPVFYCQHRVGKDFRTFRLFKFRSMYSGCSKGSLLTGPQDKRVTRVGRVLRKYKLDELPQLVNVLIGEMQLVGVRPQVQRYVEIFPDEYRELLREPPGVTGLASLCFRNEEEMYKEGRPVEEQYVEGILPVKLRMALEYSRRRTFRSDLEIIFRSAFGFQAPSATEPGLNLGMPAQADFISRKPS